MYKRLVTAIVIFLTAFVFASMARASDIDNKFIEAVRADNLTETERLIKAGVDLNKIDDRNDTPLMIAAEKGHLGIMRLLIESGAKINIKTKVGRSGTKTALSTAVDIDNLDAARLLIEKGAEFKSDFFTARPWRAQLIWCACL